MLDDFAAYPLEDTPYEFVEHFMTELAESICVNPEGKLFSAVCTCCIQNTILRE